MKPKLNYEATSYDEMIFWDLEGFYEPPFTENFNDDQLKEILTTPISVQVSSNSVLTERTIRTVDKVATKSSSVKIQEGMVKGIERDRKLKPNLESRSDVLG